MAFQTYTNTEKEIMQTLQYKQLIDCLFTAVLLQKVNIYMVEQILKSRRM